MARGTFIPLDKIKSILGELSGYYAENVDVIESEQFVGMDEGATKMSNGQVEASWSFVENVLDALSDNYDPRYGGFSRTPKWIWPQSVLLALSSGLWGFDGLPAQGTHTLKAIYQSEVRDRIDDGFFRYSQKRDWSAPQFEKLLWVNAWLMECYLTGYGLFGTHEFLTAAREIAEYVDTVLWLPSKGFYRSSQQADPEYFGETAAGRRKRTMPEVDQSLYTAPNAVTAMALFHFWWASRNPQYRERAEAITLNMMEQIVTERGECLHEAGSEGASAIKGYLGDQAAVSLMFSEAYQATGKPEYLETAQQVLDFCESNLVAPGGAFYDLPRGFAQSQALSLVVPEDQNALLARAYISMWGVTGDEAYVDRAHHIVDAIVPAGEASVADSATALSAAAVLRPVSVVAGSPESQLAFAAKHRMIPSLAVRYDKALENTVRLSTPGDQSPRIASAQDLSRALDMALNPRGQSPRGRFEPLPTYQRLYVH